MFSGWIGSCVRIVSCIIFIVWLWWIFVIIEGCVFGVRDGAAFGFLVTGDKRVVTLMWGLK